MSDIDDINESSKATEHWLGPQGRRAFLTKAVAVGVVAWSAPVILSRPAYALDGGGGTPNCQPKFTLQCTLYSCLQGNKQFPGFTISPTPLTCPCSHTTPPQNAAMCVKITPAPGDTAFTCGTDTVVAYGAGTNCGPGNQATDIILNTGNWECVSAASLPIFFGKARSGGGNGAISNLASCTLHFRVAIWAGNCPDRHSQTEAFTCQTFIVTICYDSSGTSSVTCTPTASCPAGGFAPASAANSLCTTTPPSSPPCCPPVKPGPKASCCP